MCSAGPKLRTHFHQHCHSRPPSTEDKNTFKGLWDESLTHRKPWISSLNHQTLSRVIWKWAQVHTFFCSVEVKETPPTPILLLLDQIYSPKAQDFSDSCLAGWLCRAWLSLHHGYTVVRLKKLTETVLYHSEPGFMRFFVINMTCLLLFSLRK